MKEQNNKENINGTNMDKEVTSELKILVDNKLPELYLPKEKREELTKQLKIFVDNDSLGIHDELKEISKQMDLIMNYITIRQSAMKDEDVQIDISQLHQKMQQALENIYEILQGGSIENEKKESSIVVYRTDGEVH